MEGGGPDPKFRYRELVHRIALFNAPVGERVDVVLYTTAFLRKQAEPDCHFWEAEPLVFLDDQLVGWGWDYLKKDLTALGKDKRYLKTLRDTSYCPD